MSTELLDLIDNVIRTALQEDVNLSTLQMAVHDRYIDLDIEVIEDETPRAGDWSETYEE